VQFSLPIPEIERASRDPQFRAAVAELFERLDGQIAARKPVCTNRGACCRFGEYGHSLFVTAVELAYFLGADQQPRLAPTDRSFCPYQQGGVCAARAARPAGCRIFFCDPASQDWQPTQTEEVLRELAAIGERFDIPYAYVEWTDALRLAGGGLVTPQEAFPAALVQIAIDTHEGAS
jgi:hypothetical protein